MPHDLADAIAAAADAAIGPTAATAGDGQLAQRRQRLVGTRDAAEYCGTTERHMRDLVQRGKIPHLKLGRLTRFDLDHLDVWIDEQIVGGSA